LPFGNGGNQPGSARKFNEAEATPTHESSPGRQDEESRLKGVVRVGGITEYLPADPQNKRAVPLQQHGERDVIAQPDKALQQLMVGLMAFGRRLDLQAMYDVSECVMGQRNIPGIALLLRVWRRNGRLRIHIFKRRRGILKLQGRDELEDSHAHSRLDARPGQPVPRFSSKLDNCNSQRFESGGIASGLFRYG
jgi:hypothetical protein